MPWIENQNPNTGNPTRLREDCVEFLNASRDNKNILKIKICIPLERAQDAFCTLITNDRSYGMLKHQIEGVAIRARNQAISAGRMFFGRLIDTEVNRNLRVVFQAIEINSFFAPIWRRAKSIEPSLSEIEERILEILRRIPGNEEERLSPQQPPVAINPGLPPARGLVEGPLSFDMKDENCQICMDNEGLRLMTTCGHVFHERCLADWQVPRRGDYGLPIKNFNACPICRHVLFT